ARNPTYTFYLKLGTWEMRKEDFQKAVPALQKALEMNPDATGPLLMLGKSLLAIQQNGPAIAALEKLVSKVPNAVEAHSFLEVAYARADRVADAAKECRIVLQYDPDDYGSHLILGKSLAILGDPAAGEAMLKKA